MLSPPPKHYNGIILGTYKNGGSAHSELRRFQDAEPSEVIGNVFKNGSLALAAPPIGCGKRFQIKAVWLVSV
jgi:hypothetical protein